MLDKNECHRSYFLKRPVLQAASHILDWLDTQSVAEHNRQEHTIVVVDQRGIVVESAVLLQNDLFQQLRLEHARHWNCYCGCCSPCLNFVGKMEATLSEGDW